MRKIIFSLAAFALLAVIGRGIAFADHNLLHGRIIALDAGHGGGETGAVGYCGAVKVLESDVNLAVRAELTTLLTNAGATAYPVAQLSTRKARVADAENAGSNVLISIHHNGSTSTSTDYTQSFVTQKNDKDFAKFIHPLLVSAFGPDKGIKNDGYGMTVYGSLPGVLTEAYFITNTNAACDFLNYKAGVSHTRVQKEAQAMYNGLLAYFSR
ncbi:MAG: N-acetylmuramoyl-L-alanine amidase [Candidatus Sungbacteria bacterium]|nr:N-acetylmuramoyl-L-alanine amidase [bacterium]MDZ4260577.1 N-acetylmuramoyl-L-alanine amidase [Candidatus Sungbacteria bacterium]